MVERSRLGNGGTTGSITGNVIDNGTLAFNRSDYRDVRRGHQRHG